VGALFCPQLIQNIKSLMDRPPTGLCFHNTQQQYVSSGLSTEIVALNNN